MPAGSATARTNSMIRGRRTKRLFKWLFFAIKMLLLKRLFYDIMSNNILNIFSKEQVMIKNTAKLNDFYRRLIKEERISYKKALSLYEAMRKEAVSLGCINSENILDGLEVDLRIARAINGLSL